LPLYENSISLPLIWWVNREHGYLYTPHNRGEVASD